LPLPELRPYFRQDAACPRQDAASGPCVSLEQRLAGPL